jgi:hypothetical protein
MINLEINERVLGKNARKARENGVLIPTFKQMREPEKYVPHSIKERLRGVGLWDVDPLNLFRWLSQSRALLRVPRIDGLIGCFNDMTGLAAKL